MEAIWLSVVLIIGAFLTYAGWKWGRAKQLASKWQRNPLSLSNSEIGEVLDSINGWERTYLKASPEVQAKCLAEYSNKQFVRQQLLMVLHARRNP